MLKNSIIFKRSRIALYTLIAFFISLETIHLTLPAIHFDEAALGNVAYSISQGQFPLMLGSYHGAIEEYFLSPFITVFGCNAISLRIFAIFVGVLVILATYFVTKEFFEEKTAIIAVALLTCNFVFLEFMKMGLAHGSIILFFMLCPLYFFLKWFRGKSDLNFYFGVFLLGMGLSTRIWFAWFIIALLISAVIFYHDLNKRIKGSKSKSRFFIISLFCFCAGSFPLVVYNLSSGFETIRCFHEVLKQFQYGVNSFTYNKNFSVRFNGFISLLNGSGFFHYLDFSLSSLKNSLYLWVFALGLIWLCFAALFLKRKLVFSRKRVLFFLLIFSLIIPISSFTVPRFGVHYMFLLIPLVCIIIAISVVSFFNIVRSKLVIFAVLAILSIAILKEANLFIKLDDHLKRSGGEGAYSDAIYRLAVYLEQEELFNVIVSHWSFGLSIRFLSSNKIQYNYSESSDNYEALVQGSPVYVAYATDEIRFREGTFLNRVNFVKTVRKMNKKLIEKVKICKRDGKPVYIVYEIE